MSHKTMLSKYGNCTRLLKIKNKLKSVVFTNKSGEELSHIGLLVQPLNTALLVVEIPRQYIVSSSFNIVVLSR